MNDTPPKSGSNGKASSDDPFSDIQPYIEKLVDIYGKLAPFIDIGQKYVQKLWKKAKPYYDEYWSMEYVQVFVGFTLCFFGGTFAMTIACYMAIKLSGWDTLKQSYTVLKQNYDHAIEAFRNDPEAKKFFDEDGDGIVTAKEMSEVGKKLFTGTAKQKKAVLMHLRCVFVAVDPQQVTNGIGGIWTVAIAVIATLRSSFAKDIALGVSIGNIVSNQIMKYAKPVLSRRFDDDMKKWADFLIESVCRFFGISLALILVRVVSAFHSGILGGQMIAKFAFKFLMNKQLYSHPHLQATESNIQVESTTVFMLVQYGLAAIGFYWQLTQGFGLNSALVRLILLPFSFCEMVLTYLAAY